MEQLPTTPVGWVIFVSVAVLAAVNLSDRWLGKRRGAYKEVVEDVEVASSRLVATLRETVNAQEERIQKLENQQVENIRTLDKLRTENGVMKEVFQGRDDSTTKFHTAMYDDMKRSEQIFGAVLTIDTKVDRLIKAIEKHLETIEKKIVP